MSEKMDAACRLIAAEVDYLSACGWVPVVVTGRRVVWHLPPGREHVDQERALERQKKKDNWPDIKE
jgi:hypothetical protein